MNQTIETTANTQPSTLATPAPSLLPVPLGPQPLVPSTSAITPPALSQSQIVTVVEVPPNLAPPRKIRRHGLIARLPKDSRDMVNRMISNGVPYNRIVDAVDECGYGVSVRNISNWATGGHLDWLQEQADVTHHRQIQDSLLDHVRRDDPSELPEAGLQAAAARISELLVHKTVTGANIESSLPQYQGLVNMLCRINREILLLQQHREERTKYHGRTRENLKIKEKNEHELQAIEKWYSNTPSSNVAPPQLPAAQEPRALPSAPVTPAEPSGHAPVPPAQPAVAPSPVASQ